ncbi:MAG TPA: type II secretion system protein GspN [Desulfobulbaceae bacterium]|nr:type II secretion system protein GspN [Desulfobulbaceae bacterium]
MMRWLLSSLGYLLYTLVVLICLLWWQFPADTVKTWLEHQLDTETPGYVWKIETLKPVLPGRIHAGGITITRIREKMPLVRIEQLDLVPDPARLLSENKLIRYSMRLFGGTAHGRLVTTTGFRQFDCRGKFDTLQIKQMAALRKRLQRQITGIAAGNFSWHRRRRSMEKQSIAGKVVIRNGILPLRKEVLGLAELSYSTIETPFTYREGSWIIEKGKFVSPKMTAAFNGRLEPADNIADFRLQFTGRLTPRSELFTGGGNNRMAGMIRSFLKDGSLPFTLSGTAAEPGIHFANGLSEAMNRLQGNRR